MKNPDSAHQALPELMLKYAHAFNLLNSQLILQGNYGPFHEKEVNSIRSAVENLATTLEYGAYILTDFSLIQQHLNKIGFDLTTLATLKKIFSSYSLEPSQSIEMLSLRFKLSEYLRTRKGEQPEFDKTIQSLLETMDAFSKECSGEVQKFISSIMENYRGQNTECVSEDYRRISYTPFTLQPMTQAQRDSVFFGIAGGAGVVLASGLFRHASVSMGPAIKNTLRNFFRR